MKLFYASGASSLAPHILLEESGLNYTAVKVNLDTKRWENGNYDLINAKSYVPALQIKTGQIITECAVILEYLSQKVPNQNFIALYNSDAYWKQRTWLNYIATELHKNFISPFRTGNWLPNTEKSKELVYNRVFPRLKYVNQQLGQDQYLVNNQFSAPDTYLFVMTNWMQRLGYSFQELDNLKKFDSNIRERPAVKRVLHQEGQPHSLEK